MDFVLALPPVVLGGAVVVLVVGIAYAWRNFQRCPHCKRVARRVYRGWLRCPHCGRQYRRGLRFN